MKQKNIFLMFVCFVALCPSQQLCSSRDNQLTLPHIFMCKLELAVNQYFVHTLSLITDNQPILNDSAEGKRMALEIIS